MTNIIFIVGLPGSGKTELAKRINQDNDGQYTIIDDPKNFDTDIKPYLDRSLIITDPTLCFEKNRNNAIKFIKNVNPNIKLDWMFFENDPTSCLSNINRRGDKNEKKVESFIKNLSQYYTIPNDANIISVYK